MKHFTCIFVLAVVVSKSYAQPITVPHIYLLRDIGLATGYTATEFGGGLTSFGDAAVTYVATSSLPSAAYYSDDTGANTPLARLATGLDNRAADINDHYRIVGSAVDSDTIEKPVAWDGATDSAHKHDLGTNSHGARFLSVNDTMNGATPRGEACGYVINSTTGPTFRGIYWLGDISSPVVLPYIPSDVTNSNSAVVTAICERPTPTSSTLPILAGYVSDPSTSFLDYPVYWKYNTTTSAWEIFTIKYGSTLLFGRASGASPDGTIVGYVFQSNVLYGFKWTASGGMVLLNCMGIGTARLDAGLTIGYDPAAQPAQLIEGSGLYCRLQGWIGPWAKNSGSSTTTLHPSSVIRIKSDFNSVSPVSILVTDSTRAYVGNFQSLGSGDTFPNNISTDEGLHWTAIGDANFEDIDSDTHQYNYTPSSGIPVSNAYPFGIQVDTTFPSTTINALVFRAVTRVVGTGNLEQQVALYNFTTTHWDAYSLGTSDDCWNSSEVTVSSTNSQYIHSTTHQVIARIGWRMPLAVSWSGTWHVEINLAMWYYK